MKRKGFIVVILTVAIALLSIPFIQAQIEDVWYVDYYPELGFEGEVVRVTYADDALALDWGEGSPSETIPSDNFSAKFSRVLTLDVPTRYEFTVSGDEMYRLFVDGVEIIGYGAAESFVEIVTTADLAAGIHVVYVEYFEETGVAGINVSYRPLSDEPVENPIGPLGTVPTSMNENVSNEEVSEVVVDLTEPDETGDESDSDETATVDDIVQDSDVDAENDVDTEDDVDAEDDADAQLLPPSLETAMLLTTESSLTGDLAAGESADFVFNNHIDEMYLFAAIGDSDTDDLVIELFDSEGTLITVQDEAYEGDPEIFLLPEGLETADYFLRISNYEVKRPASYQILMFDIIDWTFDATYNAVEQIDADEELTYDIDVTPQDLLYIYVAPHAQEDLVITIWNSDDEIELISDGTAAGETEILLFNPGEADNYLISITEFFAEAGNLDIEIGFVLLPEDEMEDMSMDMSEMHEAVETETVETEAVEPVVEEPESIGQ